MATDGPVHAATYASVAPGTLAWAAPENADASDNIYTSVGFTLAVSDEESEALRATDVLFTEVELDSTVQGLTVTIERKEELSDVRDLAVQLVYQGAVIGDNKAAAGEWPATDAVATYEWSAAELEAAGVTPAVALDPTFGAQLRVTSQSGDAPFARVDDIAFALAFTPAPASAGTGKKIHDRVRITLREVEMKQGAGRKFTPYEVDGAIADAHLVLHALLTDRISGVPNGLTIAAGANLFSLPTTETGRPSPVEYSGAIRLQRARDGFFMKKRSRDEMDRMTFGLAGMRRGPPRDYALWEEPDGTVRGLCHPRPERDERIHLAYRSLADDPRDFPNLEAATFGMDREQRTALVYLAASTLAASLRPDDLAQRHLSPHAAGRWHDRAMRLIRDSATAEHNLSGVGRNLQMVN